MHSVQSSFKSPCGHLLHVELVFEVKLHAVQALLLAAVPQHSPALALCVVMAMTTAYLLGSMVRNNTEMKQYLTLCYSDELDDMVMASKKCLIRKALASFPASPATQMVFTGLSM